MKKSVLFLSFIILTVSASGYTAHTQVNKVSTDFNTEKIERESKEGLKIEYIPSNKGEIVQTHRVEGNKTMVSGTLILRNGCKEPEHRFNKSGKNSYKLDIYSVDKSDRAIVCTQEVRYQEYKATLEAERPYTLTLNSEGQNTTEIVNNKEKNNNEENEEERLNIIGLIMKILFR